MIEQFEFEAERPRFLREALADAKKWCPAPDSPPVEGKKVSDQFWIRLFSPTAEPVTATCVHCFLVSFQLANRIEWNKDAVATRINKFRGEDARDPRTTISDLADDLSLCILSKTKGRQTSAASKIAFFSKPDRDIYIWDKFAMRSASFREGLPQKYRNYASYFDSCDRILEEERRRKDFVAAVQDFCEYIRVVGGPMADRRILSDSSFVERRLLDKLMFWEGVWIVNWKKSARKSEVGRDAERESLPEVTVASGLIPDERPNQLVEQFVDASDQAFLEAAAYVLKKNAELYRRLA